MNKRIQELAQQCWDGRPEGQLHFDNEIFAKLIVRECAEFARQHNLEKADRSHMIHKAIQKHFGVE